MQQLNSIKYLVSNDGTITLYNAEKHFVLSSDHKNYNEILEAIRHHDAETVLKLVNVVEELKKYAESDKLEIRDGVVYFGGEAIHNTITDRILACYKLNLPFDGMVKFLENLMQNPSFRARQELFDFLEHRYLPITEDGCFLAYKSVRENYLDKHSGKFNNKPGSIMEMPRYMVDDDCTNTCSYGFHVGSLSYSGPRGEFYSLGDKVVVVKVNPRDAVSVPKDYNAQKLRVCRYEVVRDYDKVLDGEIFRTDASGPIQPKSHCNPTSDSVDVDDEDDDSDDSDEEVDSDYYS